MGSFSLLMWFLRSCSGWVCPESIYISYVLALRCRDVAIWVMIGSICMLRNAVWNSRLVWAMDTPGGLGMCTFAPHFCWRPAGSLSADRLLHCSRVGSQQHCSQTSAASSEHRTPKHYSFEPRQQLCLLPPQHQAWIFQLYRQLCASVWALQPHEPRHWQWPFTSGQSRVSRQTICCIPEPNSQFPEAVI